MLESDDSVKEQVDNLNLLTGIICRMMYALTEQAAPKDADEQTIAKFCIPVHRDSLFSCSDLYELTSGGAGKKGGKIKGKVEESKVNYDEVAANTKNTD